MKQSTDSDRALAFAGILQALQLVQHTAHGETCDSEAMDTSIGTIFTIDAPTVEDVYSDISGLRIGLKLLVRLFANNKKKPDMEISRYLVTLLHLERKLTKRSDLLEQLQRGINRAQSQLDHFPRAHHNVIASLADTYTTTISTLQPRIMVQGDTHRLTDSHIANQIRTLLLAAMRSAVLWRQLGGSRLGLLFTRRKLARTAETWLNSLDIVRNIH